MEGIIVLLIDNGYYIVSVVATIYLLAAMILIRQNERVIGNKGELYAAIEEVYSRHISNLKVVAGEANKEIYEKLCPKMKKLLNENPKDTISIVIGPNISIFKEDLNMVDENGKLKTASDSSKIHPIFNLKTDAELGSRVSIYYKTGTKYSDESHFILSDQLIYNEKPHRLLQETVAVIIEQPNVLMKKSYVKDFNRIINYQSVEELFSEQDIKEKVTFENFNRSKSQGT